MSELLKKGVELKKDGYKKYGFIFSVILKCS